MRDADGRGPRTDADARWCSSISRCRDPKRWSRRSITSRRAAAPSPSLGAMVDRARAEGDPVAIDIMTDAADELALAAASVITRLDMRGEQFPILLAGGMLQATARGWRPKSTPAHGRSGAAQRGRRRSTNEPALGAVRLALAEASGGARVPPYIDSVPTRHRTVTHPTLRG